MDNYQTIMDVCKPVADFIREVYDPYTEIVISMDNIKVVTAQMGFPVEDEEK